MTVKLMVDLCDDDCQMCKRDIKELVTSDGKRMKSTDDGLCATATFVLGMLELRKKTERNLKLASAVVDS